MIIINQYMEVLLMYKFPEGFLWGGATASAQYEGGFEEGGRGRSQLDYIERCWASGCWVMCTDFGIKSLKLTR